jgi:hypothetical protein
VTPDLRHAARFALTVLALSVTACGGEGASGKGASSAGGQAHGTAKAGGEGEGEGEGDESGPPPSPCADGTCVECGAGICPKGFYCDQSAPGGAACGWLPECAKEPSCGCVKAGLGAGCDCEEKDGVPFVKCD